VTQRRLWAKFLSLLLLFALALSACAPAAPATESGDTDTDAAVDSSDAADSEEEKQIIYALYQEPELLNPFIATQTAAAETYQFAIEGLLGVNPDGDRFPVLAAEVPSVENGLVSEDGMTVTYNLKEGVVWSDGEAFTCDDVLFTFETVTNPDSGAVSTTGYDQIESVTCEDDLTVVVQYTEFYAPYLSLFGAVLPRHATGEAADMVNWEYNRMPLGTGPFVITGWDSGDQIRLEANENYRDYPDRPLVDKVIVRIIPSREVGKALITSGEIDILWDLIEADVPEFEDNPSVIANKRPSPSIERLLFNLGDPSIDATDDPVNNPHPILGDVRVRQAIEMGIDKQLIVDELLFGATTVGSSVLSIGWAGCSNEASAYDVDGANALLDDAGFTDEDGDGVRECNGCEYAEDGAPISLKFQTTTGNQLREETQQLIVIMMREIGVELNIENVPSSELFGSWSNGAFRKHGTYDILMYTTGPGIDPQSHMYSYFHQDEIPTEANAGSGFNYSRWVNADASVALVEAGATPDEAIRKAAYQIACDAIAEELPQALLYNRGDIHLSRSNIINFDINPWDNQNWNSAEWDVE